MAGMSSEDEIGLKFGLTGKELLDAVADFNVKKLESKLEKLDKLIEDFTGIRPLVVDRSCQHNWQTHTQKECGIKASSGFTGEGYAVSGEPYKQISITKVYCSHCLMVRAV